MTTEKPKPEVPPFEAFKKEFAELPLDEKVRKLLDLETITLGDTFNYVFNLPYLIGEKIRDGIAEFGFMKEEAEKKAKRPTEHKTEEKAETASDEKPAKTAKPSATKAKTAAPKKPATRKKATKPAEKTNSETSA